MIEPGGLACEGADEPCFAGAGQADDIAPKNIRLKLSSIIRIIQAHGECVLAFRRLVHGGRLHFVIEQPDGCRILLPAWMTESRAAAQPMVEVPRISLASLRELRGLVDAQHVSSSPSSETNWTGGGDDGTAHTVATTRSAGTRNGRRSATAAQSDKFARRSRSC